MKKVLLLALMWYSAPGCVGQERKFTGSTPAGAVVRQFLDLSIKDSIDFIRWRLTAGTSGYSLNCNFGIGKPNTNGFINGGNTVSLNGRLLREGNRITLRNGERQLRLVEIHSNLLHPLDTEGNLIVGNGGWSYTLCNEAPELSTRLNITSAPVGLPATQTFEGRTPCGGIYPFQPCYKLKWLITLHADPSTGQPTACEIWGTGFRAHEPAKGTWRLERDEDRITYVLKHPGPGGDLYLLKLDENILVFTDASGNLLVGNEDFSYTLNRH